MSAPLEHPGPLDEVDAEILAETRRIYARMDPVPAWLPERVKYAMSVRMLEAEVAELTQMPMAAARSETGERIDSISFSGSRVSLMVNLSAESDGVRVDCWVTLGGAMVEMRFTSEGAGAPRAQVCDEHGRCAFSALPSGPVHFVVWADADKSMPPIITPTINL